jgi:hypothetical protein
MSIIKSDDNTKYLIIKIIITTYVSVITLDLITHWETKRRQDIKLLILGVSGIGILTNLLISESLHSFLLISKIIIVLTTTGLLATRQDIDNSGKAPEELYVTLYSSIFIVFIAILWWYFGDKIKTNILKRKTMKKSYMDGEY